jgi:hypothetical protein
MMPSSDDSAASTTWWYATLSHSMMNTVLCESWFSRHSSSKRSWPLSCEPSNSREHSTMSNASCSRSILASLALLMALIWPTPKSRNCADRTLRMVAWGSTTRARALWMSRSLTAAS